MKNLIFTFIILLPLFSKAQAHLGSTAGQIKTMHSDNVFYTSYTKEGAKYIYTSMPLGTFFYYLSTETGLSNVCVQIPENMVALNAQVEIYNKKYVILSDTSWKAYLEDGGVMKINLNYNEKLELYIFYYTNSSSNFNSKTLGY